MAQPPRRPGLELELGADVDPFMLHVYAALAEKERALISERTKAALQVAKIRLAKEGKRLGSPSQSQTAAMARAVRSARATRANADHVRGDHRHTARRRGDPDRHCKGAGGEGDPHAIRPVDVAGRSGVEADGRESRPGFFCSGTASEGSGHQPQDRPPGCGWEGAALSADSVGGAAALEPGRIEATYQSHIAKASIWLLEGR